MSAPLNILPLKIKKKIPLKKLDSPGGGAGVGGPAVCHQYNSVEHGKQLTAGLVDGADDSLATSGRALQGLHQCGGAEGVQARGGLVAEQ